MAEILIGHHLSHLWVDRECVLCGARATNPEPEPGLCGVAFLELQKL